MGYAIAEDLGGHRRPEAPSGVTVADVVARGRYPHQSLLRSWSDEDERACVEAMQAANVGAC